MCLPMTSKLNAYKRFRNHRILSTTKIDLNQILCTIEKLCFCWWNIVTKNQFEWRICLWNKKILSLKKKHLVRKFFTTQWWIFYLTNPNFAWFNSSTSDFLLKAVIAFSYLIMSILSLCYGLCAVTRQILIICGSWLWKNRSWFHYSTIRWL